MSAGHKNRKGGFMSKKLIFPALMVCLLVVVAVFAFTQNSTTVRWDYYVFPLPTTNANSFAEPLNRFGQGGYELITVLQENGTSFFIFKRRLP
jgi:hypothetical protein